MMEERKMQEIFTKCQDNSFGRKNLANDIWDSNRKWTSRVYIWWFKLSLDIILRYLSMIW